jgi:hypothetical protein
MASKLVVETRMEGEDKWAAYGLFDDFDTCHKRIQNLVKKEGRIIRLMVPGGFRLDHAQSKALKDLGVQHNS